MRIRKRSTLVVARTLDDDGWCAYIRDSRNRLYLFDVKDNFFYTEEMTKSLCNDVFSSAELAQKHFKALIKPYGKFFPIIRTKTHINEYWDKKH